jgi:anti-sigma regulatory factor (Ser/Thr protein kinase)
VTPRETAQTFEREAWDAPRARHAVTDQLEAWGLGNEREVFELVVSELFTNAVRHGGGDVEVRLSHDGKAVRVEVTDQGGGRPTLRGPEPADTGGGWGLRLVSRLADDWGAEVTHGRTVVWAERNIRP